jgi:hypothetical protein
MLLRDPELLYPINRKLRELANGDAALLNDPLNDLCLDDFSHPEYRALASLFSESFDQDEQDCLTFVRGRLEGDLIMIFESILLEDFEHLRPKLRHGLSVDLQSVAHAVQLATAPPDPVAAALTKALRLRLQRLQRERQELVFLQMDDEEKEEALAQQIQITIMHSSMAKQRIETALRDMSRSPHLT